MTIKSLSQSLINKIAAGEVIERPASVVKELIENALDAEATHIDVAVEQGGLEMIRVVDNGCGIAAEELPLAVASHATSKIAEADDLFRVGTLGFRGEALASIAEVSRLVLRSRTADAASGVELEVAGGKPGAVVPCGCAVGTAVEVYNLFFNTPVRRKFLRSRQTEFGHLAEAFTRLALATPQVHFTLRHHDKSVFELAATDGPLERIARFFGRELAENLIWAQSVEGEVKISGYAAHPSQSRSHNRMQYFFLNGRYIRDRALQHALGEAYRGLLMTGRYPIAFFTLQMPPEMVDVNVHPTKLEVRFQDSPRLYSQLLATLRNKFLKTDLNTQVQMSAGAQFGAEPCGAEDRSGAHDAGRAEQLRRELVDWAKGKVAGWDTKALAEPVAPNKTLAEPVAPGSEPSEIERKPLGFYRLDTMRAASERRLPNGTGWQAASGTQAAADSMQTSAISVEQERSGAFTASAEQSTRYDLKAEEVFRPHWPPALQVHNRYLVTETDEGVMVIDQHALHERILYEQLQQRLSTGIMESQSLLVPEPVDLSAAEAAAALENRDLLASLGVKIEPFGGDTVLVVGYPAMLANISPGELLRELIERIISEGNQPQQPDLLDDLMHSIACKAAIKAGDRLTPEEIAALLEQRHLVEDSHHCPHGRPTALVFTREELDRQFKRI